MKMAQIKDLHLGKRIEDLEKHLVIPNVSARKTKLLLETARKLLRDAEKYNYEGDEELAYIFYMKYFNLLACIHKKPDYSEHKQTVRQLLGGNTTHKLTMDKLEELSQSLNKRYEAKHNAAVQSSAAQTAIAAMTAKYADRARDYNALSASEKFDLLKAETITTSPLSSQHSLQALNAITCKELFERMKQSNVLVMDCRTSSDYELSHLTYQWSFGVPEEYILAGMSAGKLQDKLDSSSKVLWSARSVKDQVVLMDWNSKDANLSSTSTIGILLDILQNWDPDVTYRAPIKILQGGYEFFIMMYPTLCTNPSVQAPQHNDEFDLIDDIEYPSINDITMKDDIRDRGYLSSPNSSMARPLTFPVQPPMPSVDRSSKLAAIKAYDQKQKPIVEIMKEHEELMEKAQANDEQLKVASMKWDNIFEVKQQNIDKKALTANEQELLYYIMQLESAATDYKIENNRLMDEIEIYKRYKKDQEEMLTPNEKENLEETTRQIENKIQERQKLDEQHEREKEHREQQLAIARENKRPLKPAFNEEEEMSKPKIPQFDRSVKPQQQAVIPPSAPARIAERQRDFSPVPGATGRGLTGLKNLGNTCYMNSILQCLSNTPQLTEYCITDKYKNYISRSNKTKGHIVEEVAALIKVLWNGNYKCVASKDLRYVIGQYQQIFRGIEQQDSHEFLTILMDWLHSDLQTLHVPEKPRDNITPSEKAWLDFTKAKESLILHLFYGQIKSTVKCVECNKESATYECFSNLSLELPSNGNVCYLSQCMDMYFSGERIHGWNCPNCKKKRDAVKKLDISKLPPVLVIHMKRFYADSDGLGQSYKKKQNYVRFPLENLDMTPYIAKSESRSVTPKTYQLYGVSNHYGSMESGHYTAFCKSGNYGRWFKFDDQVVTPLDTSNVISSAAYILFYTWLPPMQITDGTN